MSTSDWYRHFATVEAAGSSATYERTALAIAEDERLMERLDRLPVAKRQPNLLLASCTYLGAPLADVHETLDFIHSEWSQLRTLVLERTTQTNEAARTAAFLPALTDIDGPIALIEVGASAGLCLYPDRYRIRYGQARPIGPPTSSVHIDVATHGQVPVPARTPEVVWRAGVDLNPLDVRDPDDLAWLSACIWPEHVERRAGLLAAAGLVAAEPPYLVEGDLVEEIDGLLHAAPPEATPVVVHSAVLAYVDASARTEFARRVHAHGRAIWISNETPGVLPDLSCELGPPQGATTPAFFVVGLDGRRPLGISDPHGAWLRWPEDE